MDRTYRVTHQCNKGKLQQIVRAVRAYRNTAVVIGAAQWRAFFGQCRFDKNLDIKHLPSDLSARYKQTCQYQVVGILKSFISNRQNEYVDVVRGSGLGEQLKHKLFIINSLGLWQSTTPFPTSDIRSQSTSPT